MTNSNHETDTVCLDLWVEENHAEIQAQRFRVTKVLASGTSDFQRVDVVETQALGRMLLNDGKIMTSEGDEFVYHEMISHVPLFCHPNPRQVLIIGGGDGGTLREVLRHKSVEKAVMVEIDALVVDTCRSHLPSISSHLDDPRAQVLIQDGVEFVKSTDDKFDIVLIDSTDPVGMAAPLFGEEFYGNVRRLLTPEGIVVSQAESPFYFAETQKKLNEILLSQFSLVRFYNYSNLTYPGGLWSFTFASLGLCPLRDFSELKVEQSGLMFRYYTPDLHRAAFALPGFMLRNLAS